MFNKSKVFFKGKGGGLIIALDKNTPYDELKAELIEKVQKSKTFFKGASEDIQFEGKELTSEQENEIADIIIKNAGLEIGFINAEKDDDTLSNFMQKKISRENKLFSSDVSYEKGSPLSEFFAKDPVSSALAEEKVLIYNGFVRSGKLVESDGNVVIIGGVNPGGEVFAGRNIIIFGQLKGKAVAGRLGGGSAEDCFIAAILMEPELLGISSFVTRFPSGKKDKLNKSPSIAKLEAGKIILSPVSIKK